VGYPVQLPDLTVIDSTDGQLLVEFGLDWAEFGRFWRMVLAMAVRDRAASVYYHPWLAGWNLSYLVAGRLHALHPPPPEVARQVAAAAGALMCGSWLGAASRRWLGWPIRTMGQVQLIAASGSSEWAGVVWSVEKTIGVEWYRLDPPETWA
jgi:hypothetical protein